MQSSDVRTPNAPAGRPPETPGRADAGEALRRRAFETRISEAETQLEALTQRIHAVEAESVAIAAALATVRQRTLGPTSLPAHQAAAIVEAGPYRAFIGGLHGSRVERIGDGDGDAFRGERDAAPLPVEPSSSEPASELERDIWDAFANGTKIVRIACEPGGGATTLLRRLAAAARANGFADGGVVLAEVRGPVMDVAQRLAQRVIGGRPARYRRPAELRAAFAERSVFVALDRAALTDEELGDLAALFPAVRFALVDTLTRAAAPVFSLTYFDAERLVTLLESGFGGRIDGPERVAARELCTTIAAWPGRARLIGVAAAEMQRSFRSLRTEYVSGNAVVQAFIDRLSPLEQRILTIAAAARMPLPAAVFAAVLENTHIGAALERLSACELLTTSGQADFTLPRSVRALLPPALDADALTGRIVDALCDAFDPWSNVHVSDEQAGAAEALLQRALERGDFARVTALGPRLAEIAASRALFGAWGRTLDRVFFAAERAGNAALLEWARHEMGVSALLLGHPEDARPLLQTVARERARAGDAVGAAASGAVLAAIAPVPPTRTFAAGEPPPERSAHPLAEAAAPPPPVVPPIAPPRIAPPTTAAPLAPFAAVRATLLAHPAALAEASLERLSPRVKFIAIAVLAAAAFVVVAIGLWPRAASGPTIADFSADTAAIAVGGSAQLCVQAVGAATVDITPQVGLIPATGTRQCTTVSPTATTTYSAVATAADGRQDRSNVTIDVRATPAPRPLAIDGFSAQPDRIVAGGTTHLCYAVTGADLLRIVPRVGNLVRLNACEPVTLTEPHRYTYRLLAIGEGGQIAVKSVRIDVRPAPRRAPAPPAAPASSPRPASSRARVAAVPTPRRVAPAAPARPGADPALARRAVYQFDVTPRSVERGQPASLCVGVGHWAHGDVTTIGALTPGITRCYRVRPLATTTYRLRVSLDDSTAFESVTVDVRPAPRGRADARSRARETHRL